MRILTLYQEYLIKLAAIENRPYCLPKTLDSLQRNMSNFNMFLRLKGCLDKNQITQRETIKKFMNCAESVLGGDFSVVTLLGKFDEIITVFEKYDKRSFYDISVITSGLNYIQEYCLVNNIKDEKDLYVGNPSVIVKLWKQKAIDDVLLVYLIDIDDVKKKKWFSIYCRELNNVKIKDIKKRLSEEKVRLTLEEGLKILKKVFNTTSEQIFMKEEVSNGKE